LLQFLKSRNDPELLRVLGKPEAPDLFKIGVRDKHG
jgi:hypothetical protein